MRRMTNLNFKSNVKTILTKKDILSIQNEINNVSLSESIEKYLIEIVFATRNPSSIGLDNESFIFHLGHPQEPALILFLPLRQMHFFKIVIM